MTWAKAWATASAVNEVPSFRAATRRWAGRRSGATCSVNEVPSFRTATRLLVGQAFGLENSLPLRVVWFCVRFPR